jgi:hypothetical protein
MTTATMINYTVNPFWTALKSVGRGTWNFMESMGRARAAAELSRQGYHEAAKNLMLENR